jgi:cell division protein FtsB
LLGSLAVALGAVGIARVHASTRVLEIGAEITELAGEHAQLLEQRRRLRAERAYLRHPNQIRAAAREELGFVPISPGLVQRIRLIEETDRP